MKFVVDSSLVGGSLEGEQAWIRIGDPDKAQFQNHLLVDVVADFPDRPEGTHRPYRYKELPVAFTGKIAVSGDEGPQTNVHGEWYQSGSKHGVVSIEVDL
jgi:hypothetical protein